MFFCAETYLDQYMQSVKFKQVATMDHIAIFIQIKTAESVPGPGLWKMNKGALYSDLLCFG